jgi:ubiquinone/menaquinone biosynthesis C-methylase UbiE
MDLQLAIVSSCTGTGCQVQFLEDHARVDADYSEPVKDYDIVVKPGDLVAVNRATEPPQVVFRWWLTRVERVQGEQIFTDDFCGRSRPLTLAEGLQVSITADDEVFIAFGQVHDVCVGGHPAHADRLRAAFFPEIQAMYQRIASWKDMDPKHVVREGYDRIAERYLEWTQANRLEERGRYTSVLLDRLPPGARVLDLGCGAGLPTTRELARRFQVTGVDISAQQIALAQQNVPGAQFIQADVTQLDFAPASFDAVAAFYALFHIPRDEQALLLRDVATWLRPQGLLVATLGVRAIKADFAEDYLGAPMYWSSFDSEANKRLVEEAGLRIISAREETAEEFGKPVTFLWVIARRLP